MKKVFALLLAISMMLGASALGSGSPEVVINFAHVVSVDSPKGLAAEMFRELMQERSGGRVEVNVFPASQLGTDAEITEQMMMDITHMNAPLTSVLPFIIPEFEIFDLPYLFDSRDMAFNAVHGTFGDTFGDLLAKHNMVLLGWWMGEFKQIANNVRPLHTVEDLNGLRIRVSQSPVLVSQFEAVANASSIPFAEVYASLQTGVVDGLENPLTNIVNRSFYEVAGHIAMTDHGIILYPVLMSANMYKSLPADLLELLHEVLDEVSAYQWPRSLAADGEEVALLEATDGVELVWWDEAERARLFEAMSVSYDNFRATVPASEELLELLETYR